MRMLRDERGSVLALTALSMTMLLSFMALAIDLGNIYYNQRQLQTLADAAAMAGALEVDTCAGTAKCSQMTTAATKALTEGGNAGSAVTLTINNGPSALGASDPNNGNLHYVEAIVSTPVKTYFAKMFGVYTLTITARAEAGHATPGGFGMYTNDLTLNGGASIKDATGSSCGIYDGGPDMENSGATVNVGSYNVQGAVTDNGGSYTPSPSKGAVENDPYAGLTAPAQPSNNVTPSSPLSSATTLNPGYYNAFNINSGTYTVTLNSGLYYFGGAITVPGNVTISGNGVTLYFGSGGSLTMNSNSTANLTAPSSALANCASCSGIVIWQATGNTNQLILDAGSNSTWSGGVYAPSAQLTLNSTSGAASYGGTIDASSVMVNSSITLGCSGGATNGTINPALAE